MKNILENKEYKLATINVDHYLKECASDSYAYWNYDSCRNNYRKHQKKLFGYYKFNEDFGETLTCYGNKEDFLTNIRFNYHEFTYKLKNLLNLKDDNCNVFYTYHLQQILKNKIEELKQIETKEELQEKFPLIYIDYIKGNELYKSFEVVTDFTDPLSNNKKDKEILFKASNDRNYYYNCGLRFHLPYFIKEQSLLYTNIINNLDNIKNYIDNNPFPAYFHHTDYDKKKLYIINKYIDEALKCKNEELKKVYLYLVNNYLIEEINNKTIIHDEEGNEIKYIDILKKFELFITNNKKLQEYIVDWVLLPEGKKQTNSNSEKNILDKGTININPNINKYISANNRKLKFYEENPHNKKKCLAKAKGLCLNKGYTAYIYENGEILLDRIATENNIKSSIGNAIYNLNVHNFGELSRKDKMTLRKEKLCPIIIHNNNWEKNASLIIDKETTKENNIKTKKLIKRIAKNNI